MRSSLWIALLLCCGTLAWAQPDPAYMQRLEKAERLVEQAQRDPAHRQETLAKAEALVPAGASPSLRQAVQQGDAATLSQARQELTSLRAAAQATPASEAPAAAQARAALDKVLARGEFQEMKKSRWPAFIRKPAEK